jgi:ABC-type branched-subunit amino acid transport system ATPase component
MDEGKIIAEGKPEEIKKQSKSSWGIYRG